MTSYHPVSWTTPNKKRHSMNDIKTMKFNRLATQKELHIFSYSKFNNCFINERTHQKNNNNKPKVRKAFS